MSVRTRKAIGHCLHMTASHKKRSVFIKKFIWAVGLICSMICLVYFLTVDAKSDIETYPATPAVTPVSSSVPFVILEHPDLDADSLRSEMYELNRREDTQPSPPAPVAVSENPYVAITLTEEEYILSLIVPAIYYMLDNNK